MNRALVALGARRRPSPVGPSRKAAAAMATAAAGQGLPARDRGHGRPQQAHVQQSEAHDGEVQGDEDDTQHREGGPRHQQRQGRPPDEGNVKGRQPLSHRVTPLGWRLGGAARAGSAGRAAGPPLPSPGPP